MSDDNIMNDKKEKRRIYINEMITRRTVGVYSYDRIYLYIPLYISLSLFIHLSIYQLGFVHELALLHTTIYLASSYYDISIYLGSGRLGFRADELALLLELLAKPRSGEEAAGTQIYLLY